MGCSSPSIEEGLEKGMTKYYLDKGLEKNLGYDLKAWMRKLSPIVSCCIETR